MDLEFDPLLVGANLQSVLDRLVVTSRRGRKATVHQYYPVVLPVALVDAGLVTLTASISPQPLGVPATAGETTAPVANTRLANTGALAAGNWNVTVVLDPGTDSNIFRLRRRNAGDTLDIWSQRFTFGPSGGARSTPNYVLAIRVTLAANEFLVVENLNAGGVGVVYQASIWTQGPF